MMGMSNNCATDIATENLMDLQHHEAHLGAMREWHQLKELTHYPSAV
jgi:hypothetical protein